MMSCLLKRRKRSKIDQSSSLPIGGGELLLCLDVDCENISHWRSGMLRVIDIKYCGMKLTNNAE